MRSISRHIAPLVIDSLGGGHTHEHTHTDVRTETILRNQVRRSAAGAHLVHLHTSCKVAKSMANSSSTHVMISGEIIACCLLVKVIWSHLKVNQTLVDI